MLFILLDDLNIEQVFWWDKARIRRSTGTRFTGRIDKPAINFQ
jgi:hypothetical protein